MAKKKDGPKSKADEYVVDILKRIRDMTADTKNVTREELAKALEQIGSECEIQEMALEETEGEDEE